MAAISIHTLRVEGDICRSQSGLLIFVISIHTLRVEGDSARVCAAGSTKISIHTLRVEGDNI